MPFFYLHKLTDILYRLTGQRFDAGLPFAKLLWVRKHHPGLLRGATLYDAQNWLAFRLTGRRATDISNGSGTGLMDIRKRIWSKEICESLNIPEDVLPDVLPSSAVAGRLLPAMAAELRLAAGTPVVVGMGDGPSSCLGLGITRFGQDYCQIGTSAWISTYSDEPPEFGGSDGLSERQASPALALHVRGTIPVLVSRAERNVLNLAGWHGKNELYTSAFEGVAFQLRMIKDIFRKEALLDAERPSLFSGGLLRAGGAEELLSDMLGEEILVTDEKPGKRKREIRILEAISPAADKEKNIKNVGAYFKSLLDTLELSAEQKSRLDKIAVPDTIVDRICAASWPDSSVVTGEIFHECAVDARCVPNTGIDLIPAVEGINRQIARKRLLLNTYADAISFLALAAGKHYLYEAALDREVGGSRIPRPSDQGGIIGYGEGGFR